MNNDLKQAILDFDPEPHRASFRVSNLENTMVKVTANGEVCYDLEDNMFVVYDETYMYIVGYTHYPAVAWAMLEAYCESYLGKDN